MFTLLEQLSLLEAGGEILYNSIQMKALFSPRDARQHPVTDNTYQIIFIFMCNIKIVSQSNYFWSSFVI